MQLIEIVQLVLVGFIALSLIIFLFSYIGYRTRSKKISDHSTQPVIDNSMISDLNEKKPNQPKIEDGKNSKTKNGSLESEKEKKKQSRFEVFKPVKDKLITHTPKTIISNFSKESGKKK